VHDARTSNTVLTVFISSVVSVCASRVVPFGGPLHSHATAAKSLADTRRMSPRQSNAAQEHDTDRIRARTHSCVHPPSAQSPGHVAPPFARVGSPPRSWSVCPAALCRSRR
jgi:hypothetical protein